VAIADDFSVGINGDIRHTSGTTTYSVLELHRWLQDLADDPEASGDNLIDITSYTPSDRSTDNIITLNDYSSVSGPTYNIDDATAEFIYDGSISQSGGDTLYSGLVVVGSLFGTTTLQVVQNNVLYDGASPFWGTGINTDAGNNVLCRMLIKTRDSGADIDGKRIRVFARELGSTFAEFSVTMGLGNSTAAVFTNEDLNNTTDSGTIATWTEITNVEGRQGIDLNNGNGIRHFYSQWNRDSYSINQLYERSKYLSRRGSAETLYGMSGELFRGITHEWAYDAETGGPFTQNEVVSWGTGVTAGTGALLALKDDGTTGSMWIQLLTGVAPTDGIAITGVSSSASCDVAGSVTARTLSSVFLGQSTGTALIGAFGIGVEAADLSNADTLFDLASVQQQPPNNVTFTVYGLVSGEDYLLVSNNDNGIDSNQMILGVTLDGGTETSVVVGSGTIPTDTPQTGNLRIVLDTGVHKQVAYTAHNGNDTFTISSTDFLNPGDATSGNGVYIAYIDKVATSTSESITLVYSADRTLFCRVRDGGASPIKTYQSTGILGTGGGSVTAIRNSDL